MVDLHRVCVPVANILDGRDKSLARQMLFGDAFQVEWKKDEWAYGKLAGEDWSGLVLTASLAGWADPTSRVRDLGAHVYETPNIKTTPKLHLPYQSRLTVVNEVSDFVELAAGGFVHQMHIEPISIVEDDYVRIAERYLGVPYLWGGNSQYGLDCSGLVTAALRALKIVCPANSGNQEKELGRFLDENTPLERGDLIFWKGHVGLMFNDELMLHANGHHMKVVFEPLNVAQDRILAAGGGPVTSRKRLYS